jgi:hypothetical protein
MLARGHFGIDTAVARVQFHLRGNDGQDEGAAVFNDGRGGFVAGGFNGEEAGGF